MAGTADRIARAHAEKRDLAAFEAARTPAPGALTPRRRLEQLIDPGSLFEIGALTRSQIPAIEDATPGDGVVAGFADVGGRLVGVIADDPVIMARSDGSVGTNKRVRIVQQSLAGGVAIAYLADAALPAQFPDTAEGLLRRGGSDRASVVPELRLEERRAPLIAVVLGGLEGADTALLAAADLTIAGGAASDATRAIADIAVADDTAAIAAARRCLALLPHDGEDDLRRGAAPPGARFADDVDPATLSVADVLAGLLDEGSHFPIHAASGGAFATGLGVIDGTLTAYAAAGPGLGLTRAHVTPLLHIARLRRQLPPPHPADSARRGLRPGRPRRPRDAARHRRGGQPLARDRRPPALVDRLARLRLRRLAAGRRGSGAALRRARGRRPTSRSGPCPPTPPTPRPPTTGAAPSPPPPRASSTT